MIDGLSTHTHRRHPLPPKTGGVVPNSGLSQQDFGTRLNRGLTLPDEPETGELIGVTVSGRFAGTLTDGVALMGTMALTGRVTLGSGVVYF